MLGMVQLSPPYATVESKIKMAIGADTRNVRVDIFSGGEEEEVRVTVAASNKGRALATLLRKCYDDLSDYYFNFNSVAANVFEDVIGFQLDRVSIGYSTATAKASPM